MIVKTAEFVKSSSSFEHCPDENFPEYAFIGRSNVGKSSLINKVCNQSKLAKTSASPGKTQLINHFLVNETWFLVDLPGYGFAKIPVKVKKTWEVMINEYLYNRQNLMNIYVLIDSRHKPLDIDLAFMERLAIRELPFTIVFTKADKNKKSQLEANILDYKNVLSESWVELPPMIITSAEKGLGMEELLDSIYQTNQIFYNR